MKRAIEEFDKVSLVDNLDSHGLVAGDVGTVVEIYNKGEAFEVEFMTGTGENSNVVTLENKHVRPLTRDEVFHVRPISKNWGAA